MISGHMETLATECFERLQNFIHAMDGAVGSSRKHLDEKIAALESFQRAINDKVAHETIRLKRHHNRAPIIHKLPSELLIKIFVQSVDLFDWELESLKSIALVSTLWFDIIHTNFVFWPELSILFPRSVIDIVLKRNSSGPLRIRCGIPVGTDQAGQFMGLTAQHAHRWETVLFFGMNETLRQYLLTPTPLLRDVLIAQSSNGDFTGILTLSEGASLRHLDLDNVRFTWDRTRISNLKTIQLRNIHDGLPSASRLYKILSASPRVEWLLLVNLREGSHTSSTFDGLPSIIDLPCLSIIYLQKIPETLSQYLLSTIKAPACRSLTTPSIRLDQLTLGCSNMQFTNTLSAAIRASGHAQVIWDFEDDVLILQSEILPDFQDHWICYLHPADGFKVDFPWAEDTDENPWDKVAEFLSQISVPSVPTSVIVKSTAAVKLWARSKYPEEERIYRQRVVPWRQAVSLSISEPWLLDDLTEPHANGDGGFEWLCPQLRTLRLRMQQHTEAQVLAELIEVFASRRYGGGDDGLGISGGPAPLERIEVPSEVGSIIREKPAFRNVEVVDI